MTIKRAEGEERFKERIEESSNRQSKEPALKTGTIEKSGTVFKNCDEKFSENR